MGQYGSPSACLGTANCPNCISRIFGTPEGECGVWSVAVSTASVFDNKSMFSNLCLSQDIKNLMDSEMKKPTAVQRGAPEFPDLSEHQHVFPEGFVIRVTRGFPGSGFETAIGKYVRAGHVQTKEDWRRTWQPSVDRVTGGGSGVGNGESGGGENTTTQPPLISRLQHIGDLEARCQTIIRITRRMYFEWLDQRTAR